MALEIDWNSEIIDKHRRGLSDIQWEAQQPMTLPNYKIGDIVEFKIGGSGIIVEVSPPECGHPSQYAIAEIPGKKYHPRNKYAWHYEGDIKE
ncbi:MAG: hypothetical protein ACFFDN_10775 [Candidatus Hodarchaeota archaeon]